jgi:hypothetical protein
LGISPDARIRAIREADVITTETKREKLGAPQMSFHNPLKWFFASDRDELNRLIKRDEKKARRSCTPRRKEFSPELELLKYEVLRSSF